MLRIWPFTERPSSWFGSCASFGFTQNTYHACVSSSVSNSVSSAARNSPATHGLPPPLSVRDAPSPSSSSRSRSFSSMSPSAGFRRTVFLRRVDGARIGLIGCCAATIVSSLRGCICVAMALPENKPRTKGLIEPEPSPPDGSWPPAPAPRRRDTKSGLRASRFRSRKPSHE